jgi:hypothetical protein
MESRTSIVVLRRHIRARIQQDSDHPLVSIRRSEMESRESIVVFHRHVRTSSDQPPYLLYIALIGRCA